jgi:hypothetical protein
VSNLQQLTSERRSRWSALKGFEAETEVEEIGDKEFVSGRTSTCDPTMDPAMVS